MPQALPAFIAKVVIAIKGITLAKVIEFVAYTAASMAISKLLAPKAPSFADSSLSTRSQMIRSPISARQAIYGQCKASGVIVYISTTGNKNQYLHLVIAIAGHECEELGDVYLNDEKIITGSGNTVDGGSRYLNKISIVKHLGTTPQTADAALIAATTGLTADTGQWTSAHRLDGITYIYAQLTWDAEIYVGGIPNISCVVKGKKVYDPRTTTTVYSANPALAVRDYLLDTKIGMAMTSAEVDDTSITVAANVCDEQVQILPASPVVYENRYEANGMIITSAAPDENIGKLLSAMGGLIAYSGGKMVVYAASYRTPTVTLSEKHFVGPLNVQTRISARDRVNSVKGVYVSESNDWQVTDFPAVTSATYVSQDNSIVYFRDVVLPFTTSPSCAQRLSVIELRRAREEITFSARFRLEAMQVRAGDTVMITNAKLGWSAKVFEVIEWHFATEGEPPLLYVDMTLKETASSVYSWTTADEIYVADAPNTNLIDPRNPSAPTSLTLTANGTTQLIQEDGTVTSRIKANWVAPSDEFIQSGGMVVMEYKPSASTTYITWSRNEGTATEDFISGDIKIGLTYNVRLYGESYFGVSTSYLTGSVNVTGSTTAPSAPANLVAASGAGLIALDWDDNTEPNIFTYYLYRATTNNFAASTTIWNGFASGRNDVVITASTTFFYFVKAEDTLGNLSAASTVASAQASAAGSNGANVAFAFLYQRSATQPAQPANALTFTFSTGLLSGSLGSYTQTVPAGTDPIYVCTATASSTSATDTIAAAEWATAVILAENGAAGAAGAAGLNVASALIYQRSATSPAVPASTLTFTFSTGVLSGSLSPWTQYIPTVNGQPCWVSFATASSTTASDTITSGEWAAVTKLVEDGDDGTNGLNNATVPLFQRSATSPAAPSATLTYTFSTGVLSGTLGSWTQYIPSSNGQPCWTTVATASSNTATDTIAGAEWAAVTKLVEDGATGATGPVTQFTLTLTKSGGPPDALTGAGTYNAGTTVNIVAPNPDSASNSFLQWSGAWPDIDRVENVNNNSTFVTMTGDTSLIADY
jgi:hypothetical protein